MGVVSFSLWNLWLKAHLVMFLIALQISVTTFRYPEYATLIRKRPRHRDVHACVHLAKTSWKSSSDVYLYDDDNTDDRIETGGVALTENR